VGGYKTRPYEIEKWINNSVVAGLIPALLVVTMLHEADPPAKPWRAGASHYIF
jgi:hypothetical protein